MMYKHGDVFARSFTRHDRKRFGYAAVLCCSVVLLCLLAAFFHNLEHLPLHLKVSAAEDAGLLAVVEGVGGVPRGIITGKERATEGDEPLCRITDSGPDFCDVRGQVGVRGNYSTVFSVSAREGEEVESFRVRPYTRKGNPEAMSNVREWSILPVAADAGEIPRCTSFHGIPSILFSAGGFAGNYFHDYADIFVPLYLTARSFKGEVLFLVSDMNPWWFRKFSRVLQSLSDYDIIDIDKEQGTHCFSRVIIGLQYHKELVIDPSRPPHHSMHDFRAFLRNTYSLRRDHAIDLKDDNRGKRPRLLIISRKRTRAFMNVASITGMAEDFGYKVVMAELDYNVSRSAEIVNSCDVMMGVHGAGLTNFLFLPDHAVFIQVVPFGGVEPHARLCFGDPARQMEVQYQSTGYQSTRARSYSNFGQTTLS
ncbi:hypothetical protein MLD38_021400 [Melastoma candidum]|uniref:Uncharacterized protein n=1 Tax=Melastoma candidum TaxID=119954 RepID=A0ACB9QG76_9MYRT|nr:hypothetical protein MLD38_021400 [Melastoma candidum]